VKQVDYDGKFTYTHIVSVDYQTDQALMSVFPNPVSKDQQLSVRVYTPVGGEAIIRIYSVVGNEMYNRPHLLSKGTQSLELSMNGYAAGMYIVHLQIGDYYSTQKIKVVQ
jgi:hypothetical protein